jgi:hypothetical protein
MVGAKRYAIITYGSAPKIKSAITASRVHIDETKTGA